MNVRSKSLLTLLLLTVLFLPLSAQQTRNSNPETRNSKPEIRNSKLTRQQIARLEKLIPNLQKQADVPGLSIAVVRNGELAWSRGFGVTNAETRQPVDDDTVFEAASLSKPLFAYAVLKLVDSGALDLDAPLTKYLPGHYDVGNDPRLDQITVRRVLDHTSGFPNWRPRRDDPNLKIHFTPGDRFSYSGEGFVYLSKVVEHITGEPLAVFMKRTVLDPLGMTSSSYVWRDDYETRKTYQHNAVGIVTGRGKPEKANAAASLHTTARDYARFVCAMLNNNASTTTQSSIADGGAGFSSRNVSSSTPGMPANLLRPATLRLMLTPQISVAEAGSNNINRPAPKLSTSISWGLGWGLENSASGTAFWHWGDNGDVKAFVMAYPKEKSAVVIFANSATGLSVMPALVAEALGGDHPAFAWIHIDPYNSPARLMLKAIVKSDAETVLRDYRKRRAPVSASQSIGTANPNVQPTTSRVNAGRANPNARLTESQMNTIGYQLLSMKRVKDAIAVFEQNTVDFPNAFNTWDSLAEAMMINGDKEAAVKYYKKSLELNPDNTNAADKIKELSAP